MNTKIPREIGRKRAPALLLHICCILILAAVTVLVRAPSSQFRGDSVRTKDAYLSESGVPYLTDMDSYYHVRLVNNYLAFGSLGDTQSDSGEPWDSRSYSPEGRSADYQPGIVWLTAMIHELTGVPLDALEYRLAAYVSVLSVLAAYLIGWRMGGILPGFTAGLLIACAPVYAARTCYGRFDTDMFVILMELLLILFLTEALRAPIREKRALHSLCFGFTVALFSLCWTASGTLMFAGLTAAGGILYALVSFFADRKTARRAFLPRPETITAFACAALILPALLITAGTALFSDALSILTSISDTTSAPNGVLPNLLWSISELKRAKLLPDSLLQVFTGYVPGAQPTVVNGVGGVAAVLLSLIGLARLFSAGFLRPRGQNDASPARVNALYCCVLGVWAIGGLFLTLYGVRFIEHLSIPVALLAGCAVGAIRLKEKPPLLKRAVPILLCAVAVVPAAVGTVQAVAASRPSVSDASFYAMRYIRENAKDDDAVVASWWDLGYFYESAADHPALWDGATQDARRGILVSKALTSRNPELSRRVLLMLSSSGDAPIELLLSRTDARNAFETLWEALLLDQDAAVALLEQRGLTPDEAREAEALIHPAQPRETYLVLTSSMARQIAWYEYYANWDFTGTQPPPNVTVYSYTPEGIPIFSTEAGQDYLDSVRGSELFWELFFNARKTSCFTPVFEYHDGLEHVRVWLVEP